MIRSHPCWLVPATLLAAALGAPARAAADAAKADPLDAQATVPALVYRSAFIGYRRLGDAKPLPWREANDEVARIGGWRTYAREPQQPEPAPAAKAGASK